MKTKFSHILIGLTLQLAGASAFADPQIPSPSTGMDDTQETPNGAITIGGFVRAAERELYSQLTDFNETEIEENRTLDVPNREHTRAQGLVIGIEYYGYHVPGRPGLSMRYFRVKGRAGVGQMDRDVDAQMESIIFANIELTPISLVQENRVGDFYHNLASVALIRDLTTGINKGIRAYAYSFDGNINTDSSNTRTMGAQISINALGLGLTEYLSREASDPYDVRSLEIFNAEITVVIQGARRALGRDANRTQQFNVQLPVGGFVSRMTEVSQAGENVGPGRARNGGSIGLELEYRISRSSPSILEPSDRTFAIFVSGGMSRSSRNSPRLTEDHHNDALTGNARTSEATIGIRGSF